MTPSPEAQCAANIAAWFASYSLGKHEPREMRQDRCYYDRTPELLADIKRLFDDKVLRKAPAKNHGPDVEIGYREDVPGVSAQVIVHASEVEIDFDFHNPTRDIVGGVGHAREVFANWIKKQKTDPFEVAKRLRKRGINGIAA